MKPTLMTRLVRVMTVGLFSMIFNAAIAQNTEMAGQILDTNKIPVAMATVQLVSAADSTVTNETFTDTLGHYTFSRIAPGIYFIRSSYTGMEAMQSNPFQIQDGESHKELPSLYMKAADTQLGLVTIVRKKPLYEQKMDRLVINIKSGITNAAGSALDVLAKSPGVVVDRTGSTIAVNGKKGVSIMINGKMTYLPVDALIQFLNGIPSANIERIELIPTPPAKFDAGGTGGLINIVLISNPYTGWNGSYFLTAGFNSQALGAAGINFNYRDGRLNLFGNYSISHDHFLQPSTGFSQFTRGDNVVTNTSFSDRDAQLQVQNARFGLDYQLNANTTIGALVGGYNSRWTMIAHNGVTIDQSHGPDTLITTVDDPEINHWQNLMANINLQHVFKPHQTLYLDASYIYYKDDNPNTYYTDYYNGNHEFLFHEDLRSGKITPIRFLVGSANFSTPLGRNLSLETGAKMTISQFNNNVTVDRLTAGVWVPEGDLSANYSLKENIAAVFGSVTMNLGRKMSVTAGLRYEYTSSNLGTTKIEHLIDRNYGELFPTLHISRKINQENSLDVSYSRRISRPTFNDLAPFTVFFDPKTFYSGNPALQPAIANSVQASYSRRNYILSVSYTYEDKAIDNSFFQTQSLDTITGVAYLSARNYDYAQYISANLAFPWQVTAWWNMQNNITAGWRQVSTGYQQTKSTWDYVDATITTTQRFTLPAAFSLELTGMATSSGYFGTAKREPYYQLDAGLQKKLGSRDVVRFTANDLFNSGTSYRLGETLPGTDIIVNRTFTYGSIAFKFGFTHSFGNHGLKTSRDQKIGAEDELKRVHN